VARCVNISPAHFAVVVFVMGCGGAVERAARSSGIINLKKHQRDAITAFMNGRDTFVSLPTGFGKSFIYGCLPKAFDLMLGHDSSTSSLVLVVCPLKALMKDQADAFKSLGVNAAYVGDKAVSLESFLAGSL
jgi:superfamily II DNA helicase RecQ